jgi:hypothetical protein
MRLTTGVLTIAITCFLGPMALLTESHAEAGADLQQSCNDYASVMDAKLSEARSLNCEFIHGSGGWDVNRDFFVKQCVDAQANYRGLRANESGLQKSLDACKSAHAGGGGTLKVVAELTMYNMYDPKRNKDLCYLHPGDTLTKLSPDGAKAPWMHLKGTSGGCNGKTGYVYNDGKLQ